MVHVFRGKKIILKIAKKRASATLARVLKKTQSPEEDHRMESVKISRRHRYIQDDANLVLTDGVCSFLQKPQDR